MDHVDGGNNDVFVYMGGNQRVPRNVRYVRIHESVKIIRARVFDGCRNLLSIEMHDGVEIIKEEAFCKCSSLRRIKLTGVRVIERCAFECCRALEDVEFGDELDTIGFNSFSYTAIRNIKLSKVRSIGKWAFWGCEQLTDVELSEDLERIEGRVFVGCSRLRRIAIPLKNNLIGGDAFRECGDISTVDLIGGIHKTVSSLLLNSWRNEMNDEIVGINRDLRNTYSHGKTAAIQRWMERVLERITHYKLEHHALLKEFTTLLELALWKIKLGEEFGEALSKEDNESNATKKVRIDIKAARQEHRITSGANIVIKNVLPFLKLE
jgi:hypothetical protein